MRTNFHVNCAADLLESIHLIFKRLDEDGSGELSYTELKCDRNPLSPASLTHQAHIPSYTHAQSK